MNHPEAGAPGYANLTPQQVLAAAKTYLGGANIAEFVLKPESERGKDPADTPTASTPAPSKGTGKKKK